MKLNLVVPLILGFFSYYSYDKFVKVQLGEVIETKSGSIQGFISKSRDGREFQSWLRIPYAEPPVENLRFASPVPAKKWEGIRDGSYYGNSCPQAQTLTNFNIGNEDCLFLNIYVPKLDNSSSSSSDASTSTSKQSLPVMIYIHGGAFVWFSSYEFPASYFMDQDVILVTLNYRLNVFGFLSTGDENIRGNMGLKDQRLAIQWVKDNIEYFGGDKSNLIVFGDSAGSVSTHLLSISNQTRGLFNKAIMMSGTATVPWGLSSSEEAIAKTKSFAQDSGCPTGSNKELTECLRKLPASELVRVYTKDAKSLHLLHPIGFGDLVGPTIEKLDDEDAFLPRHPVDILKEGKAHRIPLIGGVVKDEGLLSSLTFHNDDEGFNFFETNFEKCLEKSFALKSPYYNKNGTAKNIWEFYFPGKFEERTSLKMSREEKMRRYTDMFSDGLFLNGLREVARVQREFSPQFFMYYYDHVGVSNQFFLAEYQINRYHAVLEGLLAFGKYFVYEYILGELPFRYGVHHSDSTYLFFDLLIPKSSEKDHELSRDLIQLWTDFAKGNVHDLRIRGEKFTPIGKDGPLEYLRLNENPQMISEPNPQRAEFWKSIRTF